MSPYEGFLFVTTCHIDPNWFHPDVSVVDQLFFLYVFLGVRRSSINVLKFIQSNKNMLTFYFSKLL